MEKEIRYKYFKDEKEEKLSNKLFYKFMLILFFFYFILIVCLQTFFANYGYVTILGQSMQPTINKNPVCVKYQNYVEKQYISDGVYLRYTHDIDYNDIIIIDNRMNEQEDTIIKRVLGFGGDYVTIVKVDNEGESNYEYRFMRVKKNSPTVEIIEEDYINGYSGWNDKEELLTEDNIAYEKVFYKTFMVIHHYEYKTFKVSLDGGKSYSDVVFFKIPENEIFFMGDNRAHSTDSRAEGALPLKKVVGKVVEIVPHGTSYVGNKTWWWNRTVGFFNVLWKEILRFFGANIRI